MKNLTEIKNFWGVLYIEKDIEKKIFIVKPQGIIQPSLIKKDLSEARAFSHSLQCSWTYIVDTSKVLLANPLNLIYLNQIKNLPGIEKFIVIAPNPIIRTLAKLFSYPVGITNVYKNQSEFNIS
ncbi:MAG: hypothetical protein H6621_08915 [Halobacteriovoraceae bacterium]|nr:hypothetical protein [Halobacteriovoraceae bacterium]MCB9095174.1 hypothetical protein [Halobacteriovoraceae bacterium]